MKAAISSAFAAVALILSTEARTILPRTILPRSLERRNDAPPLPPCPAYAAFNYVGCFVEANPTTLEYHPNLVFSTMTVETCTATCKSNGYPYAGLIYYGNCQCGTYLSAPAPAANCNAPCNGNPSQTCGANGFFSVWQDPTYPTYDPNTIGSAYTSRGCYAEGINNRAVAQRQDQLPSNTLTTEACQAQCGKQGYALAATEFGGECYCGQMLQGGSVKTDDANCSMPCTGNSAETCGGAGVLNLYEAKILESTQPCGYTPPPSPPPTKTCSGTAYGYVPGKSTTFIELGIGKNWGWVLKGSPPLSGTLYLGAGGNDISKASNVGTFTIEKIGNSLVVTYNLSGSWSLTETHFYYGSSPPTKVAPGQFGNTHGSLPQGTTTDQFTLPYDSSKTTYIVHAGIGYGC